MVVAIASYEASDSTVDSQVITLASSGANTLLLAAGSQSSPRWQSGRRMILAGTPSASSHRCRPRHPRRSTQQDWTRS